MSPDASATARTWRSVLILGGIRSGKSELAESLVATALDMTYVATARRDPADREWEARIDAHRARRPAGWSTVEVSGDPLALPDLIAGASSEQVLLVDDLGTWLAGVMDTVLAGVMDTVLASVMDTVTDVSFSGRISGFADRLATSVERSTATLVLVSPEVGLSVVPATASARAFADALGTTNRAVAAACDAVALVIAGNAVPVKGAL